jgi:Xaa-Pro aminopeptidase
MYATHEELCALLGCLRGQTVALLCDPCIARLSTVDAGFVELLRLCGITPVSASRLMQRCTLLSPAGRKSHERASRLLYTIVHETWQFFSERYHAGQPLTESEGVSFILSRFNACDLVTNGNPIVAFGPHSANPHYEAPLDGGRTAQKGDVIQIDIWAIESLAADDDGRIAAGNAIYADISWVGIFDTEAPPRVESCFKDLCASRDAVCEELRAAFNAGKTITGRELDALTRAYLIDAGYGAALRHRTGHGIDSEDHGSGVNLDSIEFPDDRAVIEGSCFSVEPGIYFSDFGLRTEINVYILNNEPVISGLLFGDAGLPIPQTGLLTM